MINFIIWLIVGGILGWVASLITVSYTHLTLPTN